MSCLCLFFRKLWVWKKIRSKFVKPWEIKQLPWGREKYSETVRVERSAFCNFYPNLPKTFFTQKMSKNKVHTRNEHLLNTQKFSSNVTRFFYFHFFHSRVPESRKIQFARIHTSSLIKIEKTLNRPITKFYNGDDVNVIAAELRLTKTRPTSFNKKHNLL